MGFSVHFDSFDCTLALVGGLIIALASSFAFIVYGRVTGLSGIFFGTLKLQVGPNDIWRVGFLTGMLLSALIPSILFPDGVVIAGKKVEIFDSISSLESNLSTPIAIIAGLLVGFGTKLGNGCTSGHGVCGLPRLSPRSFVAVCVFMSMGILVSTYIRHFLPKADTISLPIDASIGNVEYGVVGVIVTVTVVAALYYALDNAWVTLDIAVGMAVGFLFGVGLLVSGMGRQSKIFSFLTLSENWNPALMFVMLGAVCLNLLTFQYTLRILQKSISGRALPMLPSTIDMKLITGAAIFGIGWGIGGLCPGPALMNLFRSRQILYFLVSLACGQLTADAVSKLPSKGKVA